MIGTAPLVLVSKDVDSHAVITALMARICCRKRKKRLSYKGQVNMTRETRQHTLQDILPIVDQIVKSVLPGHKPKSYEISLRNLSAAAKDDRSIVVSGFSVGATAFAVLLSARLQISIRQDTVATGHLASTDGRICMVSSLLAKLQAALQDPVITRFVYPALDGDYSLLQLTPSEREEIDAALTAAKRDICLIPITNVRELAEAIFTERGIVLGALQSNFYEEKPPLNSSESPIEQTASFLRQNNKKRFWRILNQSALANESNSCKELLEARVQYQIANQSYPQGFGRRLLQLFLSLPPLLRRKSELYPLFPPALYHQLCSFATLEDQIDTHHLMTVMTGRMEPFTAISSTNAETKDNQINICAITSVDEVVREISRETLVQKIGQAIDWARASYVVERITVRDHLDFQERITSFYLHLLCHTDREPTAISTDAIAADAIALVDSAFRDQGGVKGALMEARYGHHGGLAYVLNQITEQYKREQYAKQINLVLKSAIAPLDHRAKVGFVAELMKRISPSLPPDLTGQDPEDFAQHWEEISKIYVQSLEPIKNLLRRL